MDDTENEVTTPSDDLKEVAETVSFCKQEWKEAIEEVNVANKNVRNAKRELRKSDGDVNAQLKLQTAQSKLLEAEIWLAEVEVKVAQAEVNLTKAKVKVAEPKVTEEEAEVKVKKAEVKVAQAEVKVAEKKVEEAKAKVGEIEAKVKVTEPKVTEEEAKKLQVELAKAELNWEETKVALAKKEWMAAKKAQEDSSIIDVLKDALNDAKRSKESAEKSKESAQQRYDKLWNARWQDSDFQKTTSKTSSDLWYEANTHSTKFKNEGREIGLYDDQHGTYRDDIAVHKDEEINSLIDEHINDQGSIDENLLKDTCSNLDPMWFRNAYLANSFRFPALPSKTGEMFFQQTVYSSLAMLLLSAAKRTSEIKGENVDTNLHYAADQYVGSSLGLHHKPPESKDFSKAYILIKPDAALAYTDKRVNAFAMMEIKPEEDIGAENCLVDHDRCVVLTAATSIAIYKALKEKQLTEKAEKVMLPFVIATGPKCILCVVKLSKDGEPSVSRVQLGTNDDHTRFHQHDVSTGKERSEVFVALALLLNRFLVFFEENHKHLQDFLTQAIRHGARACLSSRSTSKRASGDRKGSSKRTKTGQDAHNEDNAALAASCNGRFEQVEFPFVRVLRFDSSGVVLEGRQVESPYYFVAKARLGTDAAKISRRVFLKVWKADEVHPEEVETELAMQWKAHVAGVSVPTPYSSKPICSKLKDGTVYHVIAMEYIELDNNNNNNMLNSPLDLVRFSRSLIDTVRRLHEQAGLLHCDLSPGNVIWSQDVVKLLDFGRSQMLNGRNTNEKGTRGFEAPEIVNGEVHTVASDTFAVGRIIQHTIEKAKLDKEEVSSNPNTLQLLEDVSNRLSEENPEARLQLGDAFEELNEVENTDWRSQKKTVHDSSSWLGDGERSPPHKLAKLMEIPVSE